MTPLYRIIAGSCEPFTAGGSDAFYRVGAPLAVGTLARERVIDAPSARFAAITLTERALTLPDPRLYDRELETECARGALGGELRCLPSTSTPIIARYTDDACLVPLLLAEVDIRRCAPAAGFAT